LAKEIAFQDPITSKEWVFKSRQELKFGLN
jgi:hypothetical protein